eukprot:6816117-Prymnesium_polylepis.2
MQIIYFCPNTVDNRSRRSRGQAALPRHSEHRPRREPAPRELITKETPMVSRGRVQTEAVELSSLRAYELVTSSRAVELYGREAAEASEPEPEDAPAAACCD